VTGRLLDARQLTKRYGGVTVLDHVDFDVAAGEVHALVGENGAGKSTLIKILGGAVRSDEGTVHLDGAALPAGDPLGVRRRGVSIVYQEFTLVPDLSVAENIFLGAERGRMWLQRGEMAAAAERRLNDLGVRLDVRATVASLTVAHQQMVEIARALEANARVLILDEPSSSLSQHEVERLLAVVRQLRERGLGIVYISHRFDEVFSLADRITVLRDGKKVASAPAGEFDRARLIRAMVGRDVSEEYPKRAVSPGETVLEVRGLSHAPRFAGVDFDLRRGEIVGLAGLVGAGRTSVGLALGGALSATGVVRMAGRPLQRPSPDAAMASGIAYVTEDRKGRGLFPELSAAANITIAALETFARGGVLQIARERDAAARASRDFDVRVSSLAQPAATLSGGNQQKLLLARFLMRPLRLLILDEPTRGVDVGARAEIYRLMNRLTADGLAILMISSELPELLGMSDRVIVMREGRVTGTLSRADATPEAVMALATRAA
jgi:ABC-type sugar transport system ATPase subunit